MRIGIALSILFACLTPKMASACPCDEKKQPAVFERLKSMVGTWKGTSSDMGDTPVEVRYRTIAGGTALLETIAPGTDHEMASVYAVEDGTVVMTHYCVFGNHPKLKLQHSDDAGFDFALASDNPKSLARESHMHSLRISMIDCKTMVQRWTHYEKGKEKSASIMKFERQGPGCDSGKKDKKEGYCGK